MWQICNVQLKRLATIFALRKNLPGLEPGSTKTKQTKRCRFIRFAMAPTLKHQIWDLSILFTLNRLLTHNNLVDVLE